jgi:hypothetical protein
MKGKKLKTWLLKKLQEKTILKNHLRGNDYEVCAAAERCIPNNLDFMVLENI